MTAKSVRNQNRAVGAARNRWNKARAQERQDDTMWTDKVKAIVAIVTLGSAVTAWAVSDRMRVADQMHENSERITTLEAQRTEDSSRLARIEAKLDALMARPRG